MFDPRGQNRGQLGKIAFARQAILPTLRIRPGRADGVRRTAMRRLEPDAQAAGELSTLFDVVKWDWERNGSMIPPRPAARRPRLPPP
jgi:hypothetical protein